MAEYINREAGMKEIELADYWKTAVKGKWLEHPDKRWGGYVVCSDCGTAYKRGNHVEYWYKFCPNCGVKKELWQ